MLDISQPPFAPPVPVAAAGRFVVSSACTSPGREEDGVHLARRQAVKTDDGNHLMNPELPPPVERLVQGARVQPEFSGQALPRVSVKRHNGPQPTNVDVRHLRPPSPPRSGARSPGAGPATPQAPAGGYAGPPRFSRRAARPGPSLRTGSSGPCR